MKKINTMKKLLLLVLASSLLMAMPLTVFAQEETGNTAVQQARSGIVHFEVSYVDDSGDRYPIQSGNGFLINNQHVVTCSHLTQISGETLEIFAELMGVDKDTLNNSLSIMVTGSNGTSLKAKVVKRNDTADFAILKLESGMSGYKAIPLRNSDGLVPPEDCCALGFPSVMTYEQGEISYTSRDVVVHSGKVENIATVGGIDYILSNADVSEGFSGGALVDKSGNVIGIIKTSYLPDGLGEASSYAISTGILCDTLDSMGISYTSASGTSGGTSTNTPWDPYDNPSGANVNGWTGALPGSMRFAP